MDKKTVFVKTSSGENEIRGISDKLYGDAKRVLHLVDDKSTVGEISKRAPPSLRDALNDVLQELSAGGYIRDKNAPLNEPQKSTLKMSTPAFKMAVPKHAPYQKEKEQENPVEELDFSFITSAASPDINETNVAKQRAEAEAAAIARMEAESRLKKEAEELRQKTEQAALKARAELEATKARVEAEARTRIESELRSKQEAEAARLKAEQESEKARLELAAVKAKAEEELKIRLEAEARAKAEEEARKKREAEAENLRIEKERAELEIARIKAESEQKVREEAEKRIRAEVEARLKAEEIERVRREAEAELLKIEGERAELEHVKAKAEVEHKMREEAELRIRAEVEARLKAEEFAKHGERRSQPQESFSSATVHTPHKEDAEKVGQAEKLRQSFAESFEQTKDNQDADTSNFKLDEFSLEILGQEAGKTPPDGDSTAKEAIEQKARKEAEDKRIKAEQEAAQLKAAQDEAARIKAEQDAIRLKAEQEAYRLKIAQEEERAKAEAETQKLAEQQGKQWEEAQRRAAAQAQAEQERQIKESAEAQLKSKKKISRGPRRKLPVGKMVAGLFAIALLAIAGLPYIWPTEEYIKPLEAKISTHLKQPVHIGQIHFALLPLPKLVLSKLEVGDAKELMVNEAVLNFDFSALFAHTRSINSLVLDNMTLSGDSLDKTLAWLQNVGGMEEYPVARMELLHVGLKSNDVKLPLLSGKADFDSQGKFSKAVLKSEDDKFAFELQSLQRGFQLELNLHESSLPIFPSIKFKDLSVNGTIENGEFASNDFFAHMYGGTVTGKGKLFWSNGWKLIGQLNAKSLELHDLFPDFGVTGQLYGDVNISMYGPVLAQLDKDPRMEGSFEAKDGVLNKLDIDTVARFGTRQGAGGRTGFTELTGNLKADKRSQHFVLNKIAAGSASGSGVFEIDADKQLGGKLMVEIKGMDKHTVLLQLSGTPAEPLLQAGR